MSDPVLVDVGWMEQTACDLRAKIEQNKIEMLNLQAKNQALHDALRTIEKNTEKARQTRPTCHISND
jgi:hypothetical protein